MNQRDNSNVEKKESGSVFGGLFTKLIATLILAGIVFGTTWYFAEDIPTIAQAPLQTAKSAAFETGPVGEYIGSKLPIPGNIQAPLLAAVATIALCILIFAITFTARRPKTVAAMAAVAVGIVSYVFYFGDPTPPELPGGSAIAVELINNTKSEVTVKSGGYTYGTLTAGGGKQKFDLPKYARVFFEASPELPNGRVIPDITLTGKPGSFALSGHEAWDAVENRKRIAYYRANKYSYDIRYIDPFDIDNNSVVRHGNTSKRGGMRKQIFQDFDDLTKSTYHYHETDVPGYFIEKHFQAKNTNEGRWEKNSTSYGSENSMKEGISANLTTDVEFAKAKASRSASVDHMSSNGRGQSNVYITTRFDKKLYEINTVKKDILLTDEFKDAVKNLPEQPGLEYKAFVDDWGTHYANKVTYGGIGIQMNQVSDQQFNGLIESGFSLSASAKIPVKGATFGGSAEGNYTRSDQWSNYFNGSTSITRWKGGDAEGGNLENYSVSASNVQPIEIDTTGTRLSTLLTSDIFRDGTTEEFLKTRRKALAAEENAVAGDTDNFNNLRPRLYHIHCNYMERFRISDEDRNPYTESGYTHLLVKDENDRVVARADNLWSVNNGRANNMTMPYNQRITLLKNKARDKTQIVFQVPAGKDPGNYKVELSVRIELSHRSYANGDVGPGPLFVCRLSDINGETERNFRPENTVNHGKMGRFVYDCGVQEVTNQWFK